MGIDYVEDPFIMGVFNDSTCPSRWVLYNNMIGHDHGPVFASVGWSVKTVPTL